MAHFLTLLATGARPAELFPSSRSTHVALLKKEIDPNTGTVTIRSAKQQPGQRGISTRVKVAKPLLEKVDSMAEAAPGPHVFSALPGLAHIFDKICMRAGIQKIDSLGQKLTAHSFRHTFGTMLAEQGASGFIIQNVMRHKDPKQTARYLERAATTAVIDISPFMIQRVKTDPSPEISMAEVYGKQ